MAKKISPIEKERLAREARIYLVRYFAFANRYNYFEAEKLCLKHDFRKMDIGLTSEYYIDKGWMKGVPLKSYGEGIKGCRLHYKYQCAIIAHTHLDVVDRIKADVDYTNDSILYRYKQDPVRRFLKVSMALNAYCRCHPETLALFDNMDDMVIVQPDEMEQEVARMTWESISNTLTEEDIRLLPSELMRTIIRCKEFKDFFLGMPGLMLSSLIRFEALDYDKVKMLSDEDYEYLLSLTEKARRDDEQYLYDRARDYLLLYQHFLKHGDINGHLIQMHKETMPFAVLAAVKHLNEGNPRDAVKILDQFRKKYGLTIFGDPYADFVYLTALLHDDSKTSLNTATTLAKKKDMKEASYFIQLMLQMKAFPEKDLEAITKNVTYIPKTVTLDDALFPLVSLSRGWQNSMKHTGELFAIELKKQGVNVLALEFASVFDVLKGDLQSLMKQTGMVPLLSNLKVKEPWEAVLDTIMQKYGDSGKTAAKTVKSSAMDVSRVSYLVNTNNWDVQPRLQKSKDGGQTWSGGRNIALKTFQKGIPEMTTQDYMVARLIESYSYGWYGETTLSLCGTNVIAALVGSPVVFDHYNPDLKIEIREDKLQVQVKETSQGYKVTYNVQKDGSTYHRESVEKENAQLLKVIKLSQQEIELLHLFDRISTFPLEAKGQLTKMLSALGKKITVMSPLLGNDKSIKQKKGNSTLTVQVVPYGEMFSVRCFAKPLVDIPPYCTPGHGLEFIAANVKGETVQVARNLNTERKNYKALLSWMEPYDEYMSDDSWQMPMEECLGVLDLLREHSDTCRIEWPEGVRFSVKRPMIGADKIRISVKGIGHWFEVDGNVEIDNSVSLKISDLLKRVRESKGNFIQLDDEEYIAISKDLRKQLAALDRMLTIEKKKLRLSEFNSSFIRDLELSGVTLDGDKNYLALQSRMEEADGLTIRVPKTLQAELRDYQLDGYRWMCRLAHWGAGACLADDMGLGKTVQTIALLLSRSSQGPSLVIMPTSVLINWQNELQRFAPTLNPVILREAHDRKEAISKVGKGDVVLATYGLLPTEDELLVSKKWNVIVLDEAHTIKNKETKTSQVAMQLNGDFRLLLTGTPLQNHLSEIWNLFQFATPGLLTDYKQFTREFITPIEHNQEKEPQRQLKRILSPFILRRTKNEVLSELPEKTEITVKVELSDKERALYDNLRQEAILKLEEDKRTAAIKALAEITRLRQTACNAALVLPAKEAKGIPSSKCETFMKLVDELIQNRHRALVFSQFTSHLALIRQELERQGIEYQYLDGAVSPTERIRRVDDFQKGEQPLFLISLKAGGTGLNLTSADYVIHLDPWWNPSIEDQASDRAYRIGQDKPVTVYRLIASNTIEEKILALHQTKKSLADALLEGSDMAHKLTTDEILELIRG